MRRGSPHFALQQITALLLTPLALWLAFFLVQNAKSAVLFQEALGEAKNRLFYGLFMVLAAYHAALGLEMIFDDYIHSEPLKKGLLWGSRMGLLLTVVLALSALLLL